jgi:hypothetical protein
VRHRHALIPTSCLFTLPVARPGGGQQRRPAPRPGTDVRRWRLAEKEALISKPMGHLAVQIALGGGGTVWRRRFGARAGQRRRVVDKSEMRQ